MSAFRSSRKSVELVGHELGFQRYGVCREGPRRRQQVLIIRVSRQTELVLQTRNVARHRSRGAGNGLEVSTQFLSGLTPGLSPFSSVANSGHFRGCISIDLGDYDPERGKQLFAQTSRRKIIRVSFTKAPDSHVSTVFSIFGIVHGKPP
jgi:hypothetical protein